MKKWVVVGAGPSMRQIDMGVVRRFRTWRVLVVNCSFRLAPWADALYAGDLQWWDRYGAETVGFAGEKWTRDAFAAHRYKLHLVHGLDKPGLCRQRGFVHIGGNSGYQAINLVWQFGARRIVLLGFDMHRNGGGHWHGEHDGMLSAPARHIEVWRRNFDALAWDLAQDRCEVVNATPGTALHCFPRAELERALRC